MGGPLRDGRTQPQAWPAVARTPRVRTSWKQQVGHGKGGVLQRLPRPRPACGQATDTLAVPVPAGPRAAVRGPNVD